MYGAKRQFTNAESLRRLDGFVCVAVWSRVESGGGDGFGDEELVDLRASSHICQASGLFWCDGGKVNASQMLDQPYKYV